MQTAQNKLLRVVIIDDDEGGINVLKKEIEQDCTGIVVVGMANGIESGEQLITT